MFWRKELQVEIRKQLSRIIDLENEREKWSKTEAENQLLRERDKNLTAETNKLRTQVREQTEADLFFVSAKICFELLNGKPKKEVQTYIEQQQGFQRALAAQQAQSAMPLYGGFQQSALGLSGLLGRAFRP